MNFSQMAFETARSAGNKAGERIEDQQQNSVIDQILRNAIGANDSQGINDLMGQVLKLKDPNKRRDMANYVSSRAKEIQKEESLKADEKLGVPAEFSKASSAGQKFHLQNKKETKSVIDLNQALNQTEKRYQNKTKALRLPFEKSDSFGNIYLDFENQEGKRDEVLNNLKKELDVYTKQVAREHIKAGIPVPQDVLDDIENSIQVKVGDEVVNLKVANKLEEFSKSHPPSKYKDETAIDPQGNRIYSDGITWTIVKKTNADQQ